MKMKTTTAPAVRGTNTLIDLVSFFRLLNLLLREHVKERVGLAETVRCGSDDGGSGRRLQECPSA
jgi:hypothetical protein